MKDMIDRHDAIDALAYFTEKSPTGRTAQEVVKALPSAQAEWNNHTVACLLADMFGDSCACNFNGIDEWLSEKCDFRDTECPHPVGVACWEQFLKYRGKTKE